MSETLRINAPESSKKPLSRRNFIRSLFWLSVSAYLASRTGRTTLGGSLEPTTRFLLLSDIHVGKENVSLRQANAAASAKLQTIMGWFIENNFDQVIQLGDMISTKAHAEEENAENLKLAAEGFKNFPDTIHLVGNHDVIGISTDKIRDIYSNEGLKTDFFGVKDFADFQIVWLDLIPKPGVGEFLPEGRIEWLESVIHPKTPIYIFSHEPFHVPDVSHNYYFKNDPRYASLINGQEVLRALSNLPIRGFIHGHLHQAMTWRENQSAAVAVPAFSERIFPSFGNPGTYSILDVSASGYYLSSFSGTRRIFDASG